MAILNKLNPKSTWVNQGADLAVLFSISIHTHTHDATAVIVIFDCYKDVPLKKATRTSRKGIKASHAFHISDEGNIDTVAIYALLLSEETKKSISYYFTKTTELHLRVGYVVSVNGKTHFCNKLEISKNHEEVDRLIIHTLDEMKPINCNVIVHATDTDVFFLLLKPCKVILCHNV